MTKTTACTHEYTENTKDLTVLHPEGTFGNSLPTTQGLVAVYNSHSLCPSLFLPSGKDSSTDSSCTYT